MGARYTLLFYFSVGLSSLDCDFKLFRHVYFRTQKSQEHSMNSSLVFLTNSTPHGDWTTAVLGVAVHGRHSNSIVAVSWFNRATDCFFILQPSFEPICHPAELF